MVLKRAQCAPIVLSLLSLASGCDSAEQRGGPRAATYAVTGEVYVDGEPGAGVLIQCHPLGQPDNIHQLATYADAQGKFSLGTYESGDGVPPGKYVLTFQWLGMGGLSGPKDKLNRRYSHPKTSNVGFDNSNGEPADLGRIELSTTIDETPVRGGSQ